jgi:folate-binding protein YgfZ
MMKRTIQSIPRHTRLPARPYICQSCASRFGLAPKARTYSTSVSTSLPSSSPAFPPSTGYAQLPTRRLISLSGPDATHFLQGVITANIAASPRASTGFYAAFLNAQGRIINDVFIYANPTTGNPGESWLVEVDANEAEKLFKHIRRYKLRSKFDVRLVPVDELAVWSIWQDDKGVGSKEGMSAGDAWTAHSIASSAPPPTRADSQAPSQISCADTRAPGMGRRLILPSGTQPPEDSEESTEVAYRVRRYMKGVAEGQGELLRETALPQESNIDYMGGVDYRKGCYVGQELTIRTHHTGVVRKRILPLMIYGAEEAMPDSLEFRGAADGTGGPAGSVPAETSIGRVEKKGRSAGKFLAGVGNVGLGLCRLEIMTDVLVQGEASTGGDKEGVEFKLEWTLGEGDESASRTVKVKAFVPSWHLHA